MGTKIDIPEDFTPEVATQASRQLAERFGVGRGTILRWRAQLGVKLTTADQGKPVPDDWMQVAPGRRNHELKEHYGVGDKMIARWRSETNVPSPVAYTGSIAKIAVRQAPMPLGDQSAAGSAATFLRKFYRPVYHRVVEDKKLAGTYVVGRNVMTADELIELAQEKGYQSYSSW